ncbi:MAG: hypothetical protein NTY12_03485 [Candidatus Falkowbacteria bacterium]|nr:hypothetical protein [Candidatus Falkowbacteria bacterium]
MDHDFIKSPLILERQPSELLLTKIMDAVAIEKQRHILRRKIFIFSSSFLLALLLIFPVLRSFISEASYSGLGEYIKLAFSDFSVISSYGKELILSILESLPALSLAALLLITAVLLVSMKNVLANAKNFYRLNHLTIN